MTDLFALLGQQRRPWLETQVVQQAFIDAARDSHPDRMHGADADARRAAQARYTQLNEARQRLTAPHARLRHLLELERGRPITDLQTISGDVMELFDAVGRACREADRLLIERAQTTSPLLKVKLFERGEEIRTALEATRESVQANLERLHLRLKEADARWAGSTGSAREPLLAELEELFRLFSFHDRWLAQIQARWVQIIA